MATRRRLYLNKKRLVKKNGVKTLIHVNCMCESERTQNE